MNWGWPPEVTVAVIGLIGILLGTMAGGAVSLITTQLNRKDQAAQREQDRKDRTEEAKRQEERWLAEFFMKVRVEALQNTVRTLTTLDLLIQRIQATLPEDNITPAELKPVFESLDKACDEVIYASTPLLSQLPPTTEEFLRRTVGLTDRLLTKLQKLLTRSAINATTLKALHVDLDALRDDTGPTIDYILVELTPPALKRFTEQ